jgi:hypothetical protein
LVRLDSTWLDSTRPGSALIWQGGISKATKKLNVSEDIFAGMDATLRGRSIVHREYYQVGKGRDMGLVSILSFFAKLASGTAEMISSRQALRLGQRLGLCRLMGFYYGSRLTIELNS